jgi:YfiH family protein
MTELTSPLFENFPHIVHGFGGKGLAAEMLKKKHALSDLVLLNQVHGDVVHEVKTYPTETLAGDGWITKTLHLALGIKTADCGSVLLYARDTQCVGAVHSGWPGVYHNIVRACAEKMTKNPSQLYAVLGPCIRQESYQVDAAFKQRFLDRYPTSEVFFQPDKTENRFLFDMPGMILWQLNEAGVMHTHDMRVNTYTHDDFYSHRRATHAGTAETEGRQISFIALTS